MENRKIEDNKLKDVNGGLIEPYQGEYAEHCGFFEKKDYSELWQIILLSKIINYIV